MGSNGPHPYELTLNELGDALKSSFSLKSNPFKKPQVADEWESYLTEKRAQNDRLGQSITDAETEVNERVHRLFSLTAADAALIMREVEH